MPSTFAQVQDAAQQVLAKLNWVDIDALATQLTGLLTDLSRGFASGDVHTDAGRGGRVCCGRTNEAVQAADLPGLTAEIRQTSTALRDTLQGEQMQKLLTNAGAGGRSAGHRGGAAAGADRLGAGDGAARRQQHADLEQGLVPLLRDMQATAQNLREIDRIVAALSGAGIRLSLRRAARRPAMRRRWVLAGAAALAGCSLLPHKPSVQRRDWPLDVRREPAAPPNPRGRVLLVRTVRAGPGLEVRGLQWLQRDGSVHVDFYEQWAVPPAQAVEDDLLQWLADSGLFSAVVAPGSRLNADFVLEGELDVFIADLNAGVARVALALVLLDQRPGPDQGAAAARRRPPR